MHGVHYPRLGQRLAPSTLAAILTRRVPVPRHGTTIRVRLADLDETVWARFGTYACHQLAEQVVEVVRSEVAPARAAVRAARLPRLPMRASVEDLDLEFRTCNCLLQAGLTDDLRRLGDWTVGDLLGLPHFGAKSLVDLLTSLEAYRARPVELAQPRHRPALPVQLLEEELLDLFAPQRQGRLEQAQRRRRIFARYHGLDGRGGVTLQQVADEEQLTRQRVAQVCCLDRPQRAALAPRLSQALAVAVAQAPARADEVARELVHLGIAWQPLSPEKLRQFALALGLPVPFGLAEVGGQIVVLRPGQEDLAGRVVRLTRKGVTRHGALTIRALADAIGRKTTGVVAPEFVARVAAGLGGFRWLDQDNGWFTVTTKRNALQRQILKVLAVARRLSATDLRTALGRDDRRPAAVPPSAVLLELCRGVPSLHVAATEVCADPTLDWHDLLKGDERALVEIFATHGPVIRYEDLEEHRLRADIRRTTFYQYVSRLPVLHRYGSQLYGLVGADVTPGMIEALREHAPRPQRSLTETRWAADGTLHLEFRLSLAQVNSGALPLSGRVKRQLPDSLAITSDDGPAGTARSGSGFFWGFGPLLRRYEARPGDRLRLTINPVGRTARAWLERGIASLHEELRPAALASTSG